MAEQRDTALPHEPQQLFMVVGLRVEEEWGRRLRPDHQIDFLHDLGRQFLVGVDCLPAQGDVPLLRLVDVGLDEADVKRVLVRRVVARVQAPVPVVHDEGEERSGQHDGHPGNGDRLGAAPDP